MDEFIALGLKSIGLLAWHCPECGTFQGYEMPDGRLCLGFPGETGGYARMMKWDCVSGRPLYWAVKGSRKSNMRAE